MISGSDRKQAEKLLQTQLPSGISNLSFFRWQPSSDLNYFHAYLKFDSTEQEFVALTDQLGMQTGDAENSGHLPACWDGPTDRELPWWDPAPQTPSDAAARFYGVNGWIVAKYERGSTYLILTDSGHAEGTPGPW